MNYLDALILGIVEGVTEFLPISSTGHLMLTSQLLNLPSTDFLKSFEISIQLGAILAVVVLYAKRVLVDIKIIKRVLMAFLPTAVLGLLLYKVVKNFLLNSTLTVLWALFIGGILLIIFEKLHHEDEQALDDLSRIPYGKAFLIGVFQSLAMIPGVSRAAATILGGLILGLKRKTIVEFSFLLAIPTMSAATALDLYKSAHAISLHEMGILIFGAGVSFVVAMLSIKFLLHFIQNHNFVSFGIYRILVAVIFGIFMI
ncbi:MAG: undecaprenyl-diphosphatase UppP [Candidatus Omnitrophica bacterium]|nr:undecaprenyl-diphosphatase UppP [Candidatus Omnitrophota bacterium]